MLQRYVELVRQKCIIIVMTFSSPAKRIIRYYSVGFSVEYIYIKDIIRKNKTWNSEHPRLIIK